MGDGLHDDAMETLSLRFTYSTWLSAGANIGMCVPSIAPAHMGNPLLSS